MKSSVRLPVLRPSSPLRPWVNAGVCSSCFVLRASFWRVLAWRSCVRIICVIFIKRHIQKKMGEEQARRAEIPRFAQLAPSTVRPLARDLRVLIGWPFPLGFGLGGRLLLARRGRVYV